MTITSTKKEKLYSFGLLADIHIFHAAANWNPNSKFDNALTFFESQNCAMCIVAGDLTQSGFYMDKTENGVTTYYYDEGQFAKYKEICDKHEMPVYELCGNHESMFGRSITNHLDKLNEFTGQNTLSYTVGQGNDLFILLGQPSGDVVMSDADFQWFAETLEANRDKRCFVFVHSYIEEDSGDPMDKRENSIFEYWGTAKKTAFINLLQQYKNVILFHGHSHMKFECQELDTDANYTTKNGFKSVHIPSLGRPRNIDLNTENSTPYADAEAQGYIVDVYEDCIVLNGMDLINNEYIPIAMYEIITSTLAEKYLTLVEKIPKVHEAGKNAMLKYHTEVTVSGSYISLKDVSELPHKVKCKINGVDNPETVQVTRCGRNLLNPNTLGSGALVEYNGVPCYSFTDRPNDASNICITGCFKENTQYTITLNGYRKATSILDRLAITIFYTDGTHDSFYVMINNKTTRTTGKGKTILKIISEAYGYETAYLDLSVSCLYEGTTALPYEPYNGQTLIPKTDGTVEGMTSVSPYMNIFTDVEGANIEATYRKSKGIEVEKEQFYNSFKKGIITDSISFEWMTGLGKTNTKSIIDGLSDIATGQTLTLNLAGVNKAYETAAGANDGVTSEAFAELVATKPNWTITLI